MRHTGTLLYMTATSRQRAVREDHLRNHERLLAAAITLFDEEGPTAPLHRIAKHAGVSEASLYRHFSGRDELVYRVYDRHATMLEEVAVDALEQHAAEAAGVRLEQLCTALITTMVRHPSYTALTLWALRTHPPRAIGEAFVNAVRALAQSCRDEGALATDITPGDIIALTVMVASTAPLQPLMGDGSWHRLLEIGLRGFTPQAARAAEPAGAEHVN